MAIGSAARRQERRPAVVDRFGAADMEAALDLLHLADMAWHDCYGPRDLAIPPDVVDDVLLCSEGDLRTLVHVALAAVVDFRDVRVAADQLRGGSR
ncbi:hypothetical protein AB0J82_00940 [Asanoa sp. NPDC049518]|uniref:hypothetical protein n=1 Tax=unclassified Asanoa TaxID=2685164 RepID=UPI00342E732C